MKKKLISLAILSITILIFSTGYVKAEEPTTVSILPAEVTISEPGQTATVDLNVTNVVNMYGYEAKIFFRNDVVNATEVFRPPGHFLEPVDPTKQFEVVWEIKNNFNSTHGRIYIGFTMFAPEAARSGSGILARITFIGLNIGTTPVVLEEVILADNKAEAIPHTDQNGIIYVIPEFLAGTLFIVFLAATTAISVIAKKELLQKHKP